MMMRTVSIIGVCCLLMCVGTAHAQGIGTASPFEFGFGSRDLALGGSSIARSDFVVAPFWNASRLAEAEHMQLSLFHARLFDSDVGYQYLGVVVPTLDFGAFGVGVARLGIDNIEKRDAGNALLGNVSDNRLGLYFAYGRAVAHYDLGITVSFEHHSLDGYSATSSPGVDLSISRDVMLGIGWLRRATVAMKGGHLVSPSMDLAVQEVSYPAVFSGAASLDIRPEAQSDHSLLLTGRIEKPKSGSAQTAFGVEYVVHPMLQFRGGIRESNLSAGAGIQYHSLQFDYSVVGRDLGAIHMLTLTTSVGRSTSERRAQREKERERAFSDLMTRRMVEQNRELVSTLKTEGDSALAMRQPGEALRLYDRALFIARSNGLDTLDLTAQADAANGQLAVVQRERQYAEFVDSAAATYQRGEYVSASYYAALARNRNADGIEARDWERRAQTALAEQESRDEIVAAQLAAIDSLLSYGDVNQAVVAADALVQFAPENAAVRRLVNRTHFESYRARATAARDRGNRPGARALVDSADAVYPGHQWCQDFRETLRPPLVETTPGRVERPEPQAPAPSPEMVREARERYERGQESFRNGDLPAAIVEWETVERIVPNYESVRSYLVQAYRLVGIDHYGRNNLADAVSTWKRAQELDPANDEIKGFIERTESEIRRLGELSYEQ